MQTDRIIKTKSTNAHNKDGKFRQRVTRARHRKEVFIIFFNPFPRGKLKQKGTQTFENAFIY